MLNWNSYEHNRECIASLKRSSEPYERIVVVDNASSDGSLELLRRLHEGDPQIHFIQNPKNFGFALGMNIGIEFALSDGADGVFLINNDTVVDPDCLVHLKRGLAQFPDAGLAGPTIPFYGSPEIVWQAGGFFSKRRSSVVVPLKGKRVDAIPSGSRTVTFLTGCAVLIARRALEKIGLLDTDYFFYGEDLDYALRARAHGIDLVYVPEARVWHKIEDVAADRTSPYVLYHLARSTALIIRKRFSRLYLVYGVAMQLGIYTPFRVMQILRGGKGLRSIRAWLGGLKDGFLLREPSWNDKS